MTTALLHITEQVRSRIRREGVDLGADADRAARLVREELRRYSERALGGTLPLIADERAVERQAVAALTGYGPLQAVLDDPEVEELWINAPDRIFAARAGRSERLAIELSPGQVRELAERMLHTTGRRVDLSSPFVDASLPDGSRLHVVIPDITREHWTLNIRKFHRSIRSLARLVELGSVSPVAAEFLRMCVLSGQSILVSGATQSGKTTLLGALLAESPESDRIVTVEETFELDLPAADVAAMQCRQPSLEGTGEVTLRRLIKEALRMRPDRLVVGEVREAEALDLLIALNSGLPGMCSIHANSARDALVKLSTLPLLAGRNIDAAFVVPTVASTIDLVVHCELEPDGRRRVVEIAAPTGASGEGVVEAAMLFARRDGVLLPTGEAPPRLSRFRRAGLDPMPLTSGGAAW
ncbi:CpaF family protein [Homoserinibacter sp. YIM 151385]|uniref:CpaF family protein n=1 Tax=Homoserinibacter sp. YIM 151385 TaxID=2985506 RepID=UPI0022F1138C|nr:ATPase, T2SS/T4P/T4SS family [Homoserinibacter sp. YIM 151385]WBU38194.1 ATPase, T2SS/T4P/T4SS family [Homoserinibacter sp. YIM 151385]